MKTTSRYRRRHRRNPRVWFCSRRPLDGDELRALLKRINAELRRSTTERAQHICPSRNVATTATNEHIFRALIGQRISLTACATKIKALQAQTSLHNSEQVAASETSLRDNVFE